jgi:hypothetical protein
MIEGVTPTGKLKTVFVTDQGRLPITIDTTTLQHVTVDTGAITAYQGGAWNVATAVGVAVTVTPSTVATTVTGVIPVGAAAVSCYPADAARKQGILCNIDDSRYMRVGNSTTQDLYMMPMTCYSPDNPAAFIGELFCKTTGSFIINSNHIYHK